MDKSAKINNLKKQAMLKALEARLGNVTLAAKDVDIDRTTHYLWMDVDADYRKAVEELANVTLDFAEGKLMELVDEKNVTAVIYYLNNKGKARGYSRKQDEDETDKTVNIVINSPLSDSE